ncbi:MAG: response regulator [Gemmatimonadaceae bacterium]|nr:response regulator [Gemmatimonadaceae bacterium]
MNSIFLNDAAGPPAGEAPLVMVAEDNPDNRMIASTMLRHSGYRVIEATTGAEAMRLARLEKPVLILMDVGMPDIDGWTATRTLKSDPETQHIIILAFTAHALPADREHALRAGCDGYLAKPVAPLRLVREVQLALLAATSKAATPAD